MTDKEAIKYMKITEGILLMALNDPGMNEQANINLDNLIEAIGMGIKALEMPAIYFVNKEGGDGRSDVDI